jgi:flagellar basal-body rod modification protein FlgD
MFAQTQPLATPAQGQPAGRATPTAAPPAGSAGGRSMINSEFETFLRMLTVQMQNQDPLNPMQSSDFAVQLATFAGVEQQTRTNQLLDGMAQKMGLGALQQTAGWVGMEALADVPVVLGRDPVDLRMTPAEGADAADLVIRDPAGRQIGRLPLEPGAEAFRWDGEAGIGRLAEGRSYRLTVESFAQGQSIGIQPALSYAKVREARIGDDGSARLVLAGGAEVPAVAVQALRTAAP